MNKLIILACLLLSLSACALLGLNQYDQMFGQAAVTERIVAPDSSDGEFYLNQVKPVVEQRCVVCHGCYDAPCQLKLSSPAGIDRGIHPEKVYNGERLLATNPSRLFIDATHTQQWRERGFKPVLNEREQTPQANVMASVLFQSLLLKSKSDKPMPKILGDEYDFSLSRQQTCSSIEDYSEFAQNNPHAGMPYGLPAISSEEFTLLESWISAGGKMANIAQPADSIKHQLYRWEAFFNQTSLKHQLTARYIYEHWFLAHLYVKNEGADTQYFKLVRSSTPPGEPIKIIDTRRPFEDPKTDQVYYRFIHDKTSTLAKTHLPLALTSQKFERIKKLFIHPDYSVKQLPGYQIESASNPFVTFAELPIKSRYQFMLDEAQFIIMGFIKGPVCRGQVALNVINDHFWVVFADPEFSANKQVNRFLAETKQKLALPAAEDSNALPISNWLKYAENESEYMTAKARLANELFANGEHLTEQLIWQGEGRNDNAALTIFRHFDSATVVKGLVGQNPKTTWIIDYPMFERIHYLLVAGFDVYGNLGHQLLTRLYMDFLRLEGERNFLALLPEDKRQPIKAHWYRKAHQNLAEYLQSDENQFNQPSGIQYQSNDPQNELYHLIKLRLMDVNNQTYQINPADKLALLNQLANQAVQQLPPVSFILVEEKAGIQAYTLLRNNAHFNISSLLNEEEQREYSEDYATLTPGFIGDYPQALWYLKAEQLDTFIHSLNQVKSEQGYFELKSRYAIRRTDPEFWQYSDLLHKVAKQNQGLKYGLFDYNRLENR